MVLWSVAIMALVGVALTHCHTNQANRSISHYFLFIVIYIGSKMEHFSYKRVGVMYVDVARISKHFRARRAITSY